jgi:cytidylate kinase
MRTKKIAVEDFVKGQIDRWQRKKQPQVTVPVITVSMEPGSQGTLIAKMIADMTGFDFFHRDIIKEIAQSVKMSEKVIDSLEKGRLSGIEDLIDSIVNKYYIHPDTYLVHLMKVINTIARHGHAVIVGRGANFILPSETCFRVRVVAPLEYRVKNVADAYGTAADAAKKRVLVRQSRRTAFVRQAYNEDISDPLNYDMVINSANLSIECAAEAVIAATRTCRANP